MAIIEGNSTKYLGPDVKSDEYQAKKGIYKIECWGAEGGTATSAKGGHGAYASGYIRILKPIILYVYVGGKGLRYSCDQPFNGGGLSQSSGGGASDVRLIGGSWYDFNSLKSRIIVAAGGGGGDGNSGCWDDGGAGGTLKGFDTQAGEATGGSQTAGGIGGVNGTFGKGGGNKKCGASDDDGNGAGGGGYFGGAGSTNVQLYGGSGGSSYISGHPGCIAIDPNSPDENNMIPLNSSIHFTGKSFFNSQMIDGKTSKLEIKRCQGMISICGEVLIGN